MMRAVSWDLGGLWVLEQVRMGPPLTLDQVPGWVESPWVGVGIIVLAAGVGWVVQAAVMGVVRRLAKRHGGPVVNSLAKRAGAPMALALPLFAAQIALPSVNIGGGVRETLQRLLSMGLIGAAAWFAIAAVLVFQDSILARHRIDVADNLQARKIHTQVRVLAKSLTIVIGIAGAAAALMTIPAVKQVGASLLASAGIAGIAVGLAARPVISNLIAGIQLAFTEPVRIDDVLIVNGEFGRVEEITPTYIVLKIWDERRMIVPLSYFIEQPFENWTRTSTALLGTVFLWVDYAAPVAELRKELTRILEASELWDRRVNNLVVTEAGADSLQLRALVSAGSASAAWDLRCEVREKLVSFLQREHPEGLPRTRAEVERVRRETVRAA